MKLRFPFQQSGAEVDGLPRIAVIDTGLMVLRVDVDDASHEAAMVTHHLPASAPTWRQASFSVVCKPLKTDAPPGEEAAADARYDVVLVVFESEAKVTQQVLYPKASREAATVFKGQIEDAIWSYLQQPQATRDGNPHRPYMPYAADVAPHRARPKAGVSAKRLWLIVPIAMAVVIAGTAFATHTYLNRSKPSLDLSSLSIKDLAALDANPFLQRRLQNDLSRALESGNAAARGMTAKIQREQAESMKALGLNAGASMENAMGCLAQ
ncbi:MAG: hypothetical protein JNM52_10335 [Betaproteobacteria bacterium]|nr:hypothetical protein [Betaproteobacteria bacterium]